MAPDNNKPAPDDNGNGHSGRIDYAAPSAAATDPLDLLTPWGFGSALYRHKWKVMAVFALIVTAAAVVLHFTPPIYQSSAKLLSRIGRESLAVDPTVNGPTLPISQSRESEINTELAILQSRYLIERVVDRIGPDRILTPDGASVKTADSKSFFGPPVPARERAVEKLARSLEIDVQGKSNIINVSLNAYSPKVAYQALEELIRLYLERHIEVHSSPAQNRFLRGQADRLAAVLSQKEEELAQFRQASNMIAPERQKQIQLEHIAATQRDLDNANTQLAASNAKIASLKKTMHGLRGRLELSRTTGKTNYAADSIKNRLAELKQKESDYDSRYSSDTRYLENLREQIRVMENQLAKERETLTEVVTGVDTTWQALQLALETERAEAEAHTARRDTLSAELARARKELDGLASRELELARRQREAAVAEADYNHSRENLRRSEDAAALDLNKISSIGIVQPATEPLKPVKPRKLFLMLLSAFLGLCAGSALALFLEAGKASRVHRRDYVYQGNYWQGDGVPADILTDAGGLEQQAAPRRRPAQ